jgi:hypothetical protein
MNKLNINIVNIVRSYTLPLTKDVNDKKYECIFRLIEKTKYIHLCLNSNICYNKSGEMCYDGLKYGKIKNINNQFWSIRKVYVY